MTATRAAVVQLLRIYEEYSFHEASLIETQKLAYFLQYAGQPLGLEFTSGSYGPYADDLRKSLRNMEGHFISGVGDDSAKVDHAESISVIPSACQRAEEFLADDPATTARVERVIALADGFTGMYGLELLATAHWTVTHDHTTVRDEIVAAIQYRTPRKATLFTEHHIDVALTRLADQNWLHLPSATVDHEIRR